MRVGNPFWNKKDHKEITMTELRFDGRVAIVTGAGNGLGRAYALLLAARGCRVVVNDLGGGAFGDGQSQIAADAVVEQIVQTGGQAVASHNSVTEGAAIVAKAIESFGRVDILINNAGILRDTSFHKMTDDDWQRVIDVHLLGAYRTTRAVWDVMRDAGYGRIVFTSSAAGLYGNFGQANYAAAKLGLVGLCQTLAVEGKKRGVLCNTVAPLAGSRLTETILPEDLVRALRPEYVAPLVAYLCHESCQTTGATLEAGGGFYARVQVARSVGITKKLGRDLSVEEIARDWTRICDMNETSLPSDVTRAMQPVMENLGSKSRGANALIDADRAIGYVFPEVISRYSERDVALYALGIGAASDLGAIQGPNHDAELRYVYEGHGSFATFPTFSIALALREMIALYMQGVNAPGLKYGFERILHGEQKTTLYGPFPTSGEVCHRIQIKDVVDKGKNALVITEITSKDASGNLLASHEITGVIRGAGGLGLAAAESSESAASASANSGPAHDASARPGVREVRETIGAAQALLYRLSGDLNPLHADPTFARSFGLGQPILHGLCTLGYAVRHVLQLLQREAKSVKTVTVRFSETVVPGDVLVTRVWSVKDGAFAFECVASPGERTVLSRGHISFYREEELDAMKSARSKKATGSKAGATTLASEVAKALPGSGAVFRALAGYVMAHPELSQTVATVYDWRLTEPASLWMMDLKSNPPVLLSGLSASHGKSAECTLEIADADFLALTSGQADPQKLFFSGKLRVTGNVMASQKLTFLQKIDPREFASLGNDKADQSAPSAAPAVAFVSPPKPAAVSPQEVASMVTTYLHAREAFLQDTQVAIVLQAPEATLTFGSAKTPTVRLTLEHDAAALLFGQQASLDNFSDLYQRGKVRIDGDVLLAKSLFA
jgi:(3R)-3-hydroxyacyl-CoA dehydrogenase / 3a,7a,12a-trihydroxy-5b-cholest-24-enoyl-CoA hydratase / enoyl-CoA hydratase 2